MKCRNVQNRLVNGNMLSEEVRKHLSECEECRLFERTLSLALESRDVSQPSVELDQKILAYASSRCVDRTNEMSAFRFPVLIPVLRIAGVAAVLALAMIFWYKGRTGEEMEASASGENQVMHESPQSQWTAEELEWTVLDVQMDAVLAELQGEDSAELNEVADENSSSDAHMPELEDRLFELELDLYFEQQELERSYHTGEQG